jgi:hypothetical protein
MFVKRLGMDVEEREIGAGRGIIWGCGLLLRALLGTSGTFRASGGGPIIHCLLSALEVVEFLEISMKDITQYICFYVYTIILRH